MDMDSRVNNVDLAIQMLRQLQQQIFDFNVSPNMLFNETNKVIQQMELAQRDVNQNFDEISRKLTDMWNGKSQQ
jgi:hypothetical protein